MGAAGLETQAHILWPQPSLSIVRNQGLSLSVVLFVDLQVGQHNILNFHKYSGHNTVVKEPLPASTMS